MKPNNEAIERYRVRDGQYGNDWTYGNNGYFQVPSPIGGYLNVVVSDGMGWDHVSVSTPRRTPNWAEMCAVKDLFFADDEVVVQFHPRKSDYVNYHSHCLHLWRPTEAEMPTPPPILVGPKVERPVA